MDHEQNQLAVIAHHQDAEVEPEEVDPEQNQLLLAHHQDEVVEEDDHSHGGRMLYVGNLPHGINRDDLHQFFEEMCGPVEHVRLDTDDDGNHLGYGFILFAELRDARAAQDLNGQFNISAGQMMKVWAVTNQNWLP